MKQNYFHITLIFFGLLSAVPTFGQEIDLIALEANIDSLIPTEVNDTTPGLVIGVIKNGELVFSKGYGLANLSYGIPNDPKMIYNLGSVTKQFLGYAFAMLHIEGKLDVDDPVGNYLDNWPEFDHEVTIRNLLTHTSGYREAYTLSNLAGRSVGIDRLTRDECLNVVRNQPALEFVPGSRFTYNSTAWVILAEILENVTEQPAHEWVSENILTPLGMNNTHIETFVGEVMPNAAESYYHDGAVGYGNSKSNRAIFGAAEVYSSLEDMVNWITNFKSQKIGGQPVMDLFLDTFILNDGTDSDYGFGINNILHKGVLCYKHTGAHESFITQLRYYPEHELGIVTVSNFGGKGWVPTNELAEYLLEDYMTFPEIVEYPQYELDSIKLQQLEGVYLSPLGNQTTNLVIINDTLTIWGGLKLLPSSENTFYSKEWGGTFEIISAKDKLPQLVVLGDAKSTFQKVAEWKPLSKELKEFQADYWSEELETVYHLEVREDQLIITHRWLGELELQPVTKDLFQSSWGLYVQFIRTKKNQISGFNINSGRTLNVFFEKEE